MTSSPTTDTRTTGFTHDARKRAMGYALVLSLVLHIGAALVFIVAGGLVADGDKTPNFIMQDFALAPSISAPPQTMVTPSPDSTHEKSAPAPVPQQDIVDSAKEPASEQPLASSNSTGNENGLMSTPLGLGMAHGYFSGLADGRSLRDDIRGYYFEMVEKINREWWDQAATLKEPIRQDGIFDVLLQRDGTIVSIRIQQGTGLVEADRLLVEIIRKASPLPPLPSTYDLGMFQAPLRIKAPSYLFRLGK